MTLNPSLILARCGACSWESTTYPDTGMARRELWKLADRHATEEHLSGNGRRSADPCITRVHHVPDDYKPSYPGNR